MGTSKTESQMAREMDERQIEIMRTEEARRWDMAPRERKMSAGVDEMLARANVGAKGLTRKPRRGTGWPSDSEPPPRPVGEATHRQPATESPAGTSDPPSAKLLMGRRR